MLNVEDDELEETAVIEEGIIEVTEEGETEEFNIKVEDERGTATATAGGFDLESDGFGGIAGVTTDVEEVTIEVTGEEGTTIEGEFDVEDNGLDGIAEATKVKDGTLGVVGEDEIIIIEGVESGGLGGITGAMMVEEGGTADVEGIAKTGVFDVDVDGLGGIAGATKVEIGGTMDVEGIAKTEGVFDMGGLGGITGTTKLEEGGITEFVGVFDVDGTGIGTDWLLLQSCEIELEVTVWFKSISLFISATN